MLVETSMTTASHLLVSSHLLTPFFRWLYQRWFLYALLQHATACDNKLMLTPGLYRGVAGWSPQRHGALRTHQILHSMSLKVLWCAAHVLVVHKTNRTQFRTRKYESAKNDSVLQGQTLIPQNCVPVLESYGQYHTQIQTATPRARCTAQNGGTAALQKTRSSKEWKDLLRRWLWGRSSRETKSFLSRPFTRSSQACTHVASTFHGGGAKNTICTQLLSTCGRNWHMKLRVSSTRRHPSRFSLRDPKCAYLQGA